MYRFRELTKTIVFMLLRARSVRPSFVLHFFRPAPLEPSPKARRTHSEPSGVLGPAGEILRCAQDDRSGGLFFLPQHLTNSRIIVDMLLGNSRFTLKILRLHIHAGHLCRKIFGFDADGRKEIGKRAVLGYTHSIRRVWTAK